MPRRALVAIVCVALLSFVCVSNADCSDTECKAGLCQYEDCTEPVNCAGGKCMFSNCESPSCSGGKCTFYACANPTCGGGSCEFFEPRTVLKDGFCSGGGCRIHGESLDDNMADGLAY